MIFLIWKFSLVSHHFTNRRAVAVLVAIYDEPCDRRLSTPLQKLPNNVRNLLRLLRGIQVRQFEPLQTCTACSSWLKDNLYVVCSWSVHRCLTSDWPVVTCNTTRPQSLPLGLPWGHPKHGTRTSACESVVLRVVVLTSDDQAEKWGEGN